MEVSQTFALIQTMVKPDKASEAFEDYRKARFPWVESSKKKSRAADIKQLMDEVKRGPLVVTPQISPRLKSHLKARVLERQVPSTPAAVKEQRHIYASMGPTIPK